MSFLSRLFGSRKASLAGSVDLDARLKKLEAEAESARPGYQGTPYNKAGDLALREGEAERAVRYYGRAIDAFLEDAQREAARGVANKIIRVHPRAVRTLCTLTWLDLASQHRATALLHLRDYVEAAKEVEEHARAGDQVYEMARLSSESEFLDAAADALDGLGFEDRAREVRAWAGVGGSVDALSESHDLAAACVSAAVRSNTGAIVEESGAGRGAEPAEPDAEAESGGATSGGREGGGESAETGEADLRSRQEAGPVGATTTPVGDREGRPESTHEVGPETDHTEGDRPWGDEEADERRSSDSRAEASVADDSGQEESGADDPQRRTFRRKKRKKRRRH